MAETIAVRVAPGLTELVIDGVRYAADDQCVQGVPAQHAEMLREAGFPVLLGSPSPERAASWALPTVRVKAAGEAALRFGANVYPVVNGYATVPTQYAPELRAEGRIVIEGGIATTPEGGLAIEMVNRTGAESVPGALVVPSAGSFGYGGGLAGANDVVGVVYDAVPDGAAGLVVIEGLADVLFVDAQAPAIGSWAAVSASVAGRAAVSGTKPAALEIGLCVEAAAGGTDVRARVRLNIR